MDEPERFFGKYKGTVLQNVDPNGIGRITASVPAVSSLLPTSWCMPCYPIAGKKIGVYCAPQIGSGVWIEFEGGDPDKPIWSGCFYGLAAEMPGDSPGANPVLPNFVIQGQLQQRIVVSDLPGPTGGIILKSISGASITVNDTGIYIDNGMGASIKLVAKVVTINDGALMITG